MTDPTPAPSPIPKRPNLAPTPFLAFLPLAPLLFMQWEGSGAPTDKRLRVLILVGSLIPASISTWLLSHGRNSLPLWVWRGGMVFGVIAVLALLAAAVVVVLRAY